MKLISIILIALLTCVSAFGQEVSLSLNTTTKAVVYFYSLSSGKNDAQAMETILFDEKEIADIRAKRVFIISVEPGIHKFGMKRENRGSIEMSFEAGKAYYIRIDWAKTWTPLPKRIKLIKQNRGASDIKQLKAIDESDIRDKNRVFRSLHWPETFQPEKPGR